MSKLGKLWSEGEGAVPVIMGEIITLRHYMHFSLNPAPKSGHEKAPTHDVVMRGVHGKPANIGVAWRQKIKAGNSSGLDMFSIQITDPDLPVMRVAAFPLGKSGMWEIQTERPRQSGEAEPENGVSAEAAAA